MENHVVFFSGGKDGLYALYLAQENGINVEYLLTLKTTIGLSPHYENIEAMAKMAEIMGKKMVIFDMKDGSDKLSNFISALDVSGIIGGDISLEDHLKWIEKLSQSADIKAIEPLWKRNSLELVMEIVSKGFQYSIIAVDKKKLSKNWLGYTFRNSEDIEKFVKENPAIDPAGEGGEFHTFVIQSPLFDEKLDLKIIKRCESAKYDYLKFDI
jgi:uncharacterized protein (TIGR00290 family)